ncbi:AAA family ATPase [Nocardia sp. NPDC088792]|uniref:AAA family ATPase n=1 Tax=Nocardia sp. NPDC088792 TaxID=3364332 RepID=UPI0038055E33
MGLGSVCRTVRDESRMRIEGYEAVTEIYDLTPEEEAQLELWDAQQRFTTYTLAEAANEASEQGDWLVPGLIASTSTLVYGEAKIGKSWLVAHLVSALVSGGEFLGVEVPRRPFSVGVCFTDDAGHREYSNRIGSVLPGTDHPVMLYGLPMMKRADWDALHRVVTDAGHNVLVIDNLTQILDGSMIDDDVIRRCFDGIRRFTRSGIPVVIVGHATDAQGKNGWKPDRPMGSASISQSVRWLMQIRSAKGGNLKVKTYGNIDHGRTLEIRPEEGARFTVLSGIEMSEIVAKNRERSADVLDRTADQARFVVDQCQGMSQRSTAEALAEKFGGSAGTYRNSLGKGRLSKLVTKPGDRWEAVTR